jgi:hypothetical protein
MAIWLCNECVNGLGDIKNQYGLWENEKFIPVGPTHMIGVHNCNECGEYGFKFTPFPVLRKDGERCIDAIIRDCNEAIKPKEI